MPTEATSERILRVATELLQEVGLDGFSMRKLAGRLDLSAPALYRHYADKEQLLVAACAEGFELFGRSLWRALSEKDDWQRLLATTRQYYRFAKAEPHFYRVMFMTQVERLGWSTVSGGHQQRIAGTFEFLIDRVRAAALQHPMLNEDARAVAASIWAHGHGLVALRLDGHFCEMDEPKFEAFFDECARGHVEGLRKVNSRSAELGQ